MAKRRARRRAITRNGPFREILAHNAISAVRDESYRLVAKVVDELLEDPEVARKIEFYTRQIFKTLAEKM